MEDHCFLSAARDAEAEAVAVALANLSVRVSRLAPFGHELPSAIEAIREAAFVIALVPREPGSVRDQVATELGVAMAFDKPVVILAHEGAVDIPSSLMAYRRVAVFQGATRTTETLRLAVDWARRAAEQPSQRIAPTRREPAPHFSSDAIQQARQQLEAVRDPSGSIRGYGFERLVGEMLVSLGPIAQEPQEATGQADFVVWVDDLQGITGNPLLVEAKTYQRRSDLDATARSILKGTSATTALVIVLDCDTELPRLVRVDDKEALYVKYEDLLDALDNQSFAEAFLDFWQRAYPAISAEQ